MPSLRTRDRVRAHMQREGLIGDGAGACSADHINDSEYQFGGRPSKTGGIYGSESQVGRRHIDQQNKRAWPSDTDVKRRSQRTGRKGGVQGSNGNGPPGNWYSAGPGRSRG